MSFHSVSRSQWVTSLLLVTLVLPSLGHSILFRKVPQEEYLMEQGRQLELPCISDQRNVQCAWMLDGTMKMPLTDRYEYSLSSPNGDCSIILKNLTFSRDNGVWQCQVPSAELDGAKWPKTSVVVLVKPSAPRFKEDSFNFGQFTAEKVSSIMCESEGGNPLPTIEWHLPLNGENITFNATTTVKGKSVISTLNYVFKKRNNASSLACVSVHPLEKQSVKQLLNVLYKPVVSVPQKMYTVVDENNLEINCQVDSNPKAQIFWKPSVDHVNDKFKVNGTSNISRLFLPKISYQLDGIDFQCSAQNSIGLSEPETIKLNVLYQPRLTDMSPLNHKVALGDELRLECKFSGNPKPRIRWNFVDSIYSQEHSPEATFENPGMLIIQNVSYTDEGDYYCEGTNENKLLNKLNIVRGNKMTVDVVGKPQFLKKKDEIVGYQNTNTHIVKEFCSDPPPTSVEWLYDGLVHYSIDVNYKDKKSEQKELELEVGIEGHINAAPLMPLDPRSPKPTCFRTAIFIVNTDISDTKDYIVIVKNGPNSVAEGLISLQVSSQISGAMIVSLSIIVVAILVLLVILWLLVLQKRRDSSQMPNHESADPAKQVSVEKNDEINAYANIDFMGFDPNQSQPAIPRQESTLYAKISFDS